MIIVMWLLVAISAALFVFSAAAMNNTGKVSLPVVISALTVGYACVVLASLLRG